jgi:hypothetical protein
METFGNACLAWDASLETYTIIVSMIDENGFDVVYCHPKMPWACARQAVRRLYVEDLPQVYIEMKKGQKTFTLSKHVLRKVLKMIQE